MAKLKYTFKTDTLFKVLFVQHPELLKRLVAALLAIEFESIGQFGITNPELPSDIFGKKFCRLDINMVVDGQRINLEIQVRDEGDYPERVLFHWSRLYSSALPKGDDYLNLPRTVVISIVNFNLFECAEFHSEFRPFEVTRHEPLSDRMSLHFFELKKLPEEIDSENMLLLWLWLFSAETEEELRKIEALEVPVMKQAIKAYNEITVTPKFVEAARVLELAAHNEAAALRHARTEERKIWEGVVAEKDAENERLRTENVGKDAENERLRTENVGKDAENEHLRAQLTELQAKLEGATPLNPSTGK